MSHSAEVESTSARSLRSSATRNPRRRQRTTEGDSLKTAAPRRKRSKLSDETFASRASIEAEEIPHASNGVSNGTHRVRDETPVTTTDLDLPVRARKGTVKRSIKGDGSKILTQNKTYSAKLLPSTPRELFRAPDKYRGNLGAGHHAVLVSREKAYIWDHTAHTPVSHATEFEIPFSTSLDEALPFAHLVTRASSIETGLLIISASTGKVVLYESIQRAASIGLFQSGQAGTHGSLGALHIGEHVSDVVASEHSEYIVLLSSGRVLRLSLFDPQGKPRISTQQLRAAESSAVGIFGSIKGFLGSMLHKGIVAVKTRPLNTRGLSQVVALSEKINVQIWDLEWSGSYEARQNINFRELIVAELKTLNSPSVQANADGVIAVEFAIVEQPVHRGDELALVGSDMPLDIWILLKTGKGDDQKYILVEILIVKEEVTIKRLQELETHILANDDKPKLLLPKPGHTGYLIFDKAVVLFATTDISIDGPEAQLHASYQDLRPFEDAVHLRGDRRVHIVSAVSEDSKAGQSSCIAFVEGAGLVRFSAINPAGDIERTRISAKDRLSQAVFYGGKEDNVIEFSQIGDSPYAIEEVEAAAVSLSNDILNSSAAPFSKIPISIEEHISARISALHALATHLTGNYAQTSSRTFWQLLWNAEKLVAGKGLWALFEKHKASAGKGKRAATVIDELCRQAQQRYNWAKFDGVTGDELVQNVFVYGLQHLDDLLPLSRIVLEELRGDSSESPDKVVRIVNETDDIWRSAMYDVFDFRVDEGSSFGITPELPTDGVLVDSDVYSKLPEFWTSTDVMLKAIIKVTQLSRDFALEFFSKDDVALSAGVEERIAKISSENPRLIELICRMFRERISWQASRGSGRDRDIAVKLQQNFDDVRYDEFRELMALGQSEAAMGLAEKYHDMHTLTELVVMDSQYFLEHQLVVQSPEEQRVVTKHLDDLLLRTGRYFDKFGDDWANAFFDAAFSGSRAGLMLDEAQNNWEEALTRYLRAQPSRARICWINDVMVQKDYARASEELVRAGREQETRLWAKKVELSMSKLALMAAQEAKSSKTSGIDNSIAMSSRELSVIKIQEVLYQHIHNEVLHCIDHEAAVAVATEKFVSRDLLPNLKRLIEAGVERVLEHQVLALGDLIDVLTLMTDVSYPEAENSDGNLRGSEFYVALTALDAAAPDLSQHQFETFLKIIWKRCYLYDNWVSINSKTVAKGNTESDLWETLRKTATWRTIYNFQTYAPLHSVVLLRPSDCFGAGCREEDLADRFSEELVRPIVADNQVQDEMLQNLVTDRRLEEWVERCERDARGAVDDEAEDEALRLQALREAQHVEDDDASDVIVVNGSTNGHINGVKG